MRTLTRGLCSAGIPRVQGQDYDSAKHAFDGMVIHLSVMRLVIETKGIRSDSPWFLFSSEEKRKKQFIVLEPTTPKQETTCKQNKTKQNKAKQSKASPFHSAFFV